MKSLHFIKALLACIVLVSFLPIFQAPAASKPAPATPVGANSGPFYPGPHYDSGWVEIYPGDIITLYHNLNTNPENLFVDMQFLPELFNRPHQHFIGGNLLGNKSIEGDPYDNMGASWYDLSTMYIKVYRGLEDTLVGKVRIRIWKLTSAPDYSSGWVIIAKGGLLVFTHNLGGYPDDYVVDLMQYAWDDSIRNFVNKRANGGRDVAWHAPEYDDRIGAWWYRLNATSISVYRQTNDIFADCVLVRIWRRPDPTYDSGWVDFDPPTSKTLYHNIGGDPDNYIVDMQFKSPGNETQVHNIYYGGNDIGNQPSTGFSDNDRVGAYWSWLNNSSIRVYRRPEDQQARSIRIRIWNLPPTIYLPLIRQLKLIPPPP